MSYLIVNTLAVRSRFTLHEIICRNCLILRQSENNFFIGAGVLSPRLSRVDGGAVVHVPADHRLLAAVRSFASARIAVVSGYWRSLPRSVCCAGRSGVVSRWNV